MRDPDSPSLRDLMARAAASVTDEPFQVVTKQRLTQLGTSQRAEAHMPTVPMAEAYNMPDDESMLSFAAEDESTISGGPTSAFNLNPRTAFRMRRGFMPVGAGARHKASGVSFWRRLLLIG
eukprot:4636280-Prymnesium_polylepis.1